MTSSDLLSQTRSAIVKKHAFELGFTDCRIAKADELTSEARVLDKWLSEKKHGEMSFLANHFDKRVDPRKLVPGAKSVVVLSLNYFPNATQANDSPQISKYAYGRDYHKVIRKKLKLFLAQLNVSFGEVEGRGFVDSAPILEKAWARKSGLGWMGKHTNIITKSQGSFYFLAVLVLDLGLFPDEPTLDHCGTCTKCIDACPTDAIEEPYKLDASKCISYLTIELKDAVLPDQFSGKFNDWMFGCDICQDVCPWNRFSKPTRELDFEPKNQLLKNDWKDWSQLTEQSFDKLFEGSAVKRTKYVGLTRNIRFLVNSKGQANDEDSA
tara:strand:+ start:1030 stop:2001 length:972 start_codon:yes stop_codon:yes gene_type:complete